MRAESSIGGVSLSARLWRNILSRDRLRHTGSQMVPTPVVRHKKGMRLITAPTAPPVRIVSRLYSWTRTATCSTLLKTCWSTLERLQRLAQLSIVLDGSQSSIVILGMLA
jgi:hypothetical protein